MLLNDFFMVYCKMFVGVLVVYVGDIVEVFCWVFWEVVVWFVREDGDMWFFEILQGNLGFGIEVGWEMLVKCWYGFVEIFDSSFWLDLLCVVLSVFGFDLCGCLVSFGVFVVVVCCYLCWYGIVLLCIGDYCFLLLFFQGVRVEYVQLLVDRLCEFKCWYDDDVLLKQVLLELFDSLLLYCYIGLCEFCVMIYEVSLWLYLIVFVDVVVRVVGYVVLVLVMVYGYLVRDEIEVVVIDRFGGCVVVSLVGVYLVVMLLLLFGEWVVEELLVLIDYLLVLQVFGEYFFGFVFELQGIEIDECGCYWVCCVRLVVFVCGFGLCLVMCWLD